MAAPASKSLFQRAVAAASLTTAETTILNPSECDDGAAAIRAARALGAELTTAGGRLLVRGGARPPLGVLDCGESGLCLRMFAPIAALLDRPIELRARGSLLGRPMGLLEEPLRRLGAQCDSTGGRPPVRVHGPMKPGCIEVDGSISSQLLTGLLLALPRLPGDSTLLVRDLKSKPYVRMTLRLLSQFGVTATADAALERFQIPGRQEYRGITCPVEGDWSGAAFPLVAAAIAGRVAVDGLALDSAQADRAILDALSACGAGVLAMPGRVEVHKAPLRAFDLDASECPDLFPALAVLACCCAGTSRISGAGRLKHKESDRARTLVEELGSVGAKIRTEADSLVIEGGPLVGGRGSSRGDHRIAMALAVAALVSRDGVTIEGDEAVAKSYPGFFADLEKLRSKP